MPWWLNGLTWAVKHRNKGSSPNPGLAPVSFSKSMGTFKYDIYREMYHVRRPRRMRHMTLARKSFKKKFVKICEVIQLCLWSSKF